MAGQLGGPVLLKQGYMQIKTTFGWKRQYYRLLQDSLFTFKSHESKTPTDELSLMGGTIKDASWQMKKANCLEIETGHHKKHYYICENSLQHQQWFDALYYGTTVSTLAEYCSPLSGGWLYYYEDKKWTRRWFMIRDSFLLCYNTREDVTPVSTDGKPINRRFVLPLAGIVVAYHKTTKSFSFSLQIINSGELKYEFIFAAESEAIMNVWMEVLYVSTGRDLPDFAQETDDQALDIDANLQDLRIFTKGNGLDREEVKVHAQDEEKFVDMHHFDHVDHGTDFQEAPPPVYSQMHDDNNSFAQDHSADTIGTSYNPKADTAFSLPGLASFGFAGIGTDTQMRDTQNRNSGCAQQ